MPRNTTIREKLVKIACDVSTRMRGVTNINVDDVLMMPANEFVLIDVRSPEERQVSILPGSVTPEEFENAADQFAEKTAIAYCTAGYRSATYAQQQKSAGRTVLNLEGGILAWCQREQSLTTIEGVETFDVHVYSKSWNLVERPYHGVW